MQGTSANCSKVALACSGTLLIGLASDGIDAQPCVLQVRKINRTIIEHTKHLIKKSLKFLCIQKANIDFFFL